MRRSVNERRNHAAIKPAVFCANFTGRVVDFRETRFVRLDPSQDRLPRRQLWWEGGRVSFLRSLMRSVQLAGYFVQFGFELLIKQPSTREDRADWLHRFCASAIHGLGIETEVTGDFPTRGAMISNHLSYLDIIVLASIHPCVFVSKAEVAGYPVLGWMTTMAGTVYVARGHGGSAIKAREGMVTALNAGLPVVFFPEGTTSNGSGLLKFHSGLLAQVISAHAAVNCCTYLLQDGRRERRCYRLRQRLLLGRRCATIPISSSSSGCMVSVPR